MVVCAVQPFHHSAANRFCSAFGNVPSGGKANKGNCISLKEDFGMPVADYGVKGFFDPFLRPLQDWNVAVRGLETASRYRTDGSKKSADGMTFASYQEK